MPAGPAIQDVLDRLNILEFTLLEVLGDIYARISEVESKLDVSSD